MAVLDAGFPVDGLIIYTLFGRGWKAFSRKNQLHTLLEGTALVERKAVIVEPTTGFARRAVEDQRWGKPRLGHMLWLSVPGEAVGQEAGVDGAEVCCDVANIRARVASHVMEAALLNKSPLKAGTLNLSQCCQDAR